MGSKTEQISGTKLRGYKVLLMLLNRLRTCVKLTAWGPKMAIQSFLCDPLESRGSSPVNSREFEIADVCLNITVSVKPKHFSCFLRLHNQANWRKINKLTHFFALTHTCEFITTFPRWWKTLRLSDANSHLRVAVYLASTKLLPQL